MTLGIEGRLLFELPSINIIEIIASPANLIDAKPRASWERSVTFVSVARSLIDVIAEVKKWRGLSTEDREERKLTRQEQERQEAKLYIFHSRVLLKRHTGNHE